MQPRRHTLNVPNTGSDGTHNVVFYDWGPEDAADVVVCVHGLTRNARDFDYLAQALAAKGRRVFAITMAGRGESAWLADAMGYHYGTYVADCIAVMNNFHLRGVEWVGTSMGGIIGMAIAANHPGRIKKLVLNDIGTFLPAAALKRIYDYVGNMPKGFADRQTALAYLKDIFAPWGIDDDAVWEHFAEHTITEDGGSIRLRTDPAIATPLAADSQNFTDVRDVNLSALWEKIEIPVLILRGEKSDLLDAETVSAMRATHTRAEAVTIPNVGHAPALASASQINIVVNWLVSGGGLKGL